jgi:hypothetical protein
VIVQENEADPVRARVALSVVSHANCGVPSANTTCRVLSTRSTRASCPRAVDSAFSFREVVTRVKV